MAKTEVLTWYFPAEKLPDDETTVLIDTEAADPWPGYLEGGQWYDASGAPISGVIAWAHMPDGVL